MLSSSCRFLLRTTVVSIQARGFASASSLLPPPPLPPWPSIDSEAVIDAICANLRRRNWKFLYQHSSCLTDPSVRRIILCLQSSPQLALEFFNWAASQQRLSPDLDTQSILIHVLVSARMFDDALCIIRKLMGERGVTALQLLNSVARTRKRCGGSRDAYDALIRGCTQIGAAEDACLLIETLRERGVWVSIHAYNNLLNHLLMSSPNGGAAFWRVYKEMLALGYVENANTFNLVIYGLCREFKMQEAFSVLYRMLKGGIFPNVVAFNMLIDGCCRNGALDLAYDLFKKVELVSGNTVKPNVITFSCLVNGMCKVGKAEEGEQLVKRDMLDKGVLPNVQTYATLIDGYAREGKPEEGFRLLIEMLDHGIVPNVVVYNSLLNWLFKLGYVEEAGSLLSDMKVHASPDHFTCAIVVDNYCRSGNMQEAIKYYTHSIEEKLVKDTIPYNSLIKYLFKQGSNYEVQQLLGRMFASGVAPDVVTYSTLIDSFFKVRKIDDALEAYNEMVKEGKKPNLITYNSIVHGFCQMEFLDAAVLVLEELRTTGMWLDICTYNTMINGYLSSHRVEEAFDLCSSMSSLGIAVNTVTCNIFMNYLCRIGCFEQAKELLSIMFSRFLIPDHITYTILITTFSKSHSATEVIELHDYMVIRGVLPDEFTYKTFVRLLIEGEEAQKTPLIEP